ncbi:MAG: MBOAT family protein [bacterium]
MLFNSLEFVTFFVVVFTLYWATVRWAGVATMVLLLASLLFYACWNPLYLLLIIASSGVDFLVGGRLHREQSPRRRRAMLISSLIYNLGVLALFKYFNFFMESLGDGATWLDKVLLGQGLIEAPFLRDLKWLDLRLDALLPVGISFFTFQSMSYTIDVYRGELEPVGEGEGRVWWHPAHFARYLLFVSFFPQLVAGPIVRARDLLPQLKLRPMVTDAMAGRGLYLILLGLFKKVVIADYLALNLVDRTFTMTTGFSSLEVLVGIYGYAFQIYCDFSGYSDIAIGAALLLGFRFPDNFNAPYIARNLQEFWHRWHISLSSWLRDYLYIALGGNRGKPWQTYRNLMLTMLLGGLWHGAGWNFVIWGALHGGALAVLRAWQRARARVGLGPLFPFAGGRVVAALITFHYVCFAWIYFRAPTLEQAQTVIDQLGELTWHTTNLDARVLLILGVAVAMHITPRRWFDEVVAAFARLPATVQAAGAVVAGLGIQAMASADAVPFIYFQF